MNKIPAILTAAFACSLSTLMGQEALTSSPYVQNFNGLSSGLPSGWSVYTAATTSSFGTDVSATRYTATPSSATVAPSTNWNFSSGGFRNYASGTDLVSTSTSAEQLAATNRALGVRQVGNTNGTFPGSDPGAAFAFRFNSSGKALTELKFDLWILDSQPRSAIYTIDYGLGSSPTVFSPLKTLSGVDTAWGKTTVTLTSGELVALNNQSDVWLRIAILDATTGSGNRDTSAIDDFSISFNSATGQEVSRGLTADFTPSSFGGNAFTAEDTAVFNGSSATVNLVGSVAANALSFTTNGYTLAGASPNSIQVSSFISVDASISSIISGVITGSTGLTKIGGGELTLSGANTFAGSVSITAGSLSVSSDSAFGATDNDIAVNSALTSTASTLALSSGRTVTGSGTINTPVGGTLNLAGPLNAGNLNFVGLTTLGLGGSTNAIANIAFDSPAVVNVTGGALQVSGGLTTAGNTTVNGDIGFTSGTKLLSTPSGNFSVAGTLTLGGGRIQKIGAGTFDLTGATTVAGTGGLQIGVVGNEAAMREGGTVQINDATDLGTIQMFFNSGTLAATAPITSAISVSFGGRADTLGASPISLPTLSGSNLTFTGNGNYFFYSGAVSAAYDRVAVEVNNTTRFEGTFAKTGTSTTAALTSRVFILVGGTGTLEFAGNASAIVDDFDLDDTVTLSIASGASLGGRRIFVDSDTTLAGAGTFVGQANDSIEPAVLVASGGTLNPVGILTLNSGLSLGGSAQFNIAGLTAGADYDRVTLTNTAGTATYTLTYGGDLNLNFSASAANGDYTLFATGTNVTRTGSFTNVFVTGTYSDTLTQSGTAWTNVIDGKTFSFEENTGVLTVSGGVGSQNFSLVNADIDGDNSVTIFDYIDLSNSFDLVLGDAGYIAGADLDGDEGVTIFDYIVLSNNFDQTGD